MTAYLKIVDRYSADYTFYRFKALSEGFPSPAALSQQPNTKNGVSLEAFGVI